jgi:alpha,alpha-trehalase
MCIYAPMCLCGEWLIYFYLRSMKKMTSLLLAFVLILQVPAQQRVQTPAETYGKLFTDVQMSGIFPDSKTFPDCTPKKDPKLIVKDYLAITSNPAIKFNLEGFVKENFDLPKTPQLNYITQEKDVGMHIKNLWGVLRREKDIAVTGSSLLPLPNPYIVPGGRFREIYYWDSYFTMLGLKESGEVEMMENMIKNFAYLINTYGHIPNGNRSYYISRSQPPFFALMVELLAASKGDRVYKTYLPALEKEYKFWMDGSEKLKPGQVYRRVVKLNDGTIMNRYWDDAATPRPEGFKEDVEVAERSGRNIQTMYRNLRAGAESGIDFSSRWFADTLHLTTIETTDNVPVDLNSLLYGYEIILSKAARATGQSAKSTAYIQKAAKRKAAVLKYCWNKKLHYFFDYALIEKHTTDKWSITGAGPLFCQLANTEQAAGVKKIIEEKFLKDGGVVTTLYHTGQQWDAPNGWAPLQFIAVKGLLNYHYDGLARTIAERWMSINEKVFASTGKMLEKYNVEDIHLESGGGEYPNQDGFGWTNGVYLKFYQLFKVK